MEKEKETRAYPISFAAIYQHSQCDKLLKHILQSFNFELKRVVQCYQALSIRSVLKRIAESGTDLNTILRCLFLFKIVVTSRNILVFKISLPLPKNCFPSQG